MSSQPRPNDDVDTRSYPIGLSVHTEDPDDFEHLRYVRGYLVSRDPSPSGAPEHWLSAEVGNGYYLHWDPRVGHAQSRGFGKTVSIVGRAYHHVLATSSLPRISEHLLRSLALGDAGIDRALYDLAGRYIVIYTQGRHTFLQTDAVGLRSAYYSDDGHTVASHSRLAAKASEKFAPSAFGDARWFRETRAPMHPGRRTEYEGIFILTPNTEIRLGSGDLRRVGPLERPALMTAAEVAVAVAPQLTQQVESLAQEHQLLISLTAGVDSRTTLAASRHVSQRALYFSYIDRRGDRPAPPSAHDHDLARRLSADVGINHVSIPITDYLASGPLHEIMRANSVRVHAPSIALAYMRTLPLDGLHLRSNVFEIGRAFYRGGSRYDLGELTPAVATRRSIRSKGHPTTEAAEFAYNEWFELTHFNDVEGYDAYDLYYWEMRMARWLPALTYESDIAHDTYIIINSRRLIETLLRAPQQDRQNSTTLHAMIHLMWPELLKYPINGQVVRYLGEARRD